MGVINSGTYTHLEVPMFLPLLPKERKSLALKITAGILEKQSTSQSAYKIFNKGQSLLAFLFKIETESTD